MTALAGNRLQIFHKIPDKIPYYDILRMEGRYLVPFHWWPLCPEGGSADRCKFCKASKTHQLSLKPLLFFLNAPSRTAHQGCREYMRSI